MEKWKGVAIIALIGALIGYGAWQSSVANQPPAAPSTTPGGPTPTPGPVQTNFVGKTLPAWSFPMTQWMNTTKPVMLNDLTGHISMVEVFRIECPHCQDAAPMIAKLYDDYSPKGFKMVSIQAPSTGSIPENNWQQVQAAVTAWGFKHPVAFDNKGLYFRKHLGGQSYPSIYLLDKKGIVRYQQTGHTDDKTKAMMAALKKLMAQ